VGATILKLDSLCNLIYNVYSAWHNARPAEFSKLKVRKSCDR
jgi:hypothetical protein